jgi:hypothetical protein
MITSRLIHDCFLPNPFQIHPSSVIQPTDTIQSTYWQRH